MWRIPSVRQATARMFQTYAEPLPAINRSIVHTVSGEVPADAMEEVGDRDSPLAGKDLDIRNAGRLLGRDVDVLPADPLTAQADCGALAGLAAMEQSVIQHRSCASRVSAAIIATRRSSVRLVTTDDDRS